jgi:hypothetical protein
MIVERTYPGTLNADEAKALDTAYRRTVEMIDDATRARDHAKAARLHGEAAAILTRRIEITRAAATR